MASISGSEVSTDGPVLNLISKKVRSLKKKYNRILQMEENQAQGKPLNKEQEDVLKSKPIVAALIDEYEKLRQPLSSAVQEELSRSSSFTPQGEEEKRDEKAKSEGGREFEDLLGILYFGCLFDVKPQSEFTSTMLTRTHERACCLTYDYVTDDATELLGERDLDMISDLGRLLTSRPVYAGVSHKNALQECVQHAKLWLQNSDQPLLPGASVTYAALREKLEKIMASDYFTTTPEMKVPVDVAAAGGKYNSIASQVVETGAVQTQDDSLQVDDVPAHYQQKDDEQEFQATEVVADQFSPVDETLKDEASELNPSGDSPTGQQDQERFEAELDYDQRDFEHKEQPQYILRRGYQNQRGGRGAGSRRGYANGRGGRGGRGGGGGSGYQNGRSQQYYEPGYYPRNYYNTRGRGGGRSGGSTMYNNNHGAAATHCSHVELGASS